MTKDLKNSLGLAKEIVAILIEKKALDVKLYNVADESSITDFYVNATGRSGTQVAALADEVTYKIGLQGIQESRVEGRGGNAWLLVDYGDVIVNVFDRQSREFYDFDRLLPRGSEIDISDIVEAVDEKFKIKSIEEV